MPRQSMTAKGTIGVWRALALGFSLSTVALQCWAMHRSSASPATPARHAGSRELAARRAAPTKEPRSVARVNALRETGDAAALAALIEIAQHGAEGVARAAIEGIAQIGGERARQFLARRFSDATDSELPRLANALAILGDAAAREVLRTAARSSRATSKAAAFEALNTLDTEDVRQFMLKALEDSEPLAANYFFDCREPRALPLLERLARSAPPPTRRTAVDALLAQGAAAEPAVERLLRDSEELSNALLESQPLPLAARPAARRSSVARLRAGALLSGSVFDFLERDLSDEAREALVQSAHDSASADRALSALSTRGDRASLDALHQLANDINRGLSERAACALTSNPDSRTRGRADTPFIKGT